MSRDCAAPLEPPFEPGTLTVSPTCQRLNRVDRIIAFAGFSLPVIGVISPVNIASILVLSLLFSIPLFWRRRKETRAPFFWYSLLALIAYSGISIFWTLNVAETLKIWLLLVFISGSSYILLQTIGLYAQECRNIGLIMRWLVLGHTIALLLLGMDIMLQPGPLAWLNNTFSRTPFHFEKLNRGATVIALTLWPCLLGIRQMVPDHRQHRLLAAAMIVATAAVLLSLDSLAAVVSLCIGLTVFTYAYWVGIAVRIVLKLSLLATLVLMPVAALFWLDPDRWIALFPDMPASMQHRLYIWKFVAHQSLEHPFFGWGLKSSKYLPGGWELVHPGMALLPLHPHNMVLQHWLELGMVGLVIMGSCLMGILAAIGRAGDHFARPVRAVYYSVFFAFMAISMTAYGFWQVWWLCTAVMAAAVTRYVAGALSAPRASGPAGNTLQEAPSPPVYPA